MVWLTATIGFPTVSCLLTSSGKQQIGRISSKLLIAVGDFHTATGDASEVNNRVRISGEHGDCCSKQAEAGYSLQRVSTLRRFIRTKVRHQK